MVKPGNHERVTAADEIQRALKGISSARCSPVFLMRKHFRAACVTQCPKLKLKRLAGAAILRVSYEHGPHLLSGSTGVFFQTPIARLFRKHALPPQNSRMPPHHPVHSAVCGSNTEMYVTNRPLCSRR